MISTIHLGMGPLGQKMLQYALDRRCFNVVGVVDAHPDKAGKDVGQLFGTEPVIAEEDINTGYTPIAK